MFCKKCGNKVPENVGFCTECGTEVAQETGPSLHSPPLPYPAPSSREAASEDRRMALIIVGIVLGVALLIVALAVALMVVVSGNDSKPRTRLTYLLNSGVDDNVVLATEYILQERLKALGIEDFNIFTEAVSSSDDNWQIYFTLNDSAAKRFADLSSELQGQTAPLNQLAIVLDYKIESYPTVNGVISDGKGQITGSFTRQEAEDLALVLRLGVMPLIFFTKSPVVEEIK